MMNLSKDKVTAHLDKSIISGILTTARASLKEPSRPFTPNESQRALFANSELARPPSAYSGKSFLKELEPIKQRAAILDAPLNIGRNGFSEKKSATQGIAVESNKGPIKVVHEDLEKIERESNDLLLIEVKKLMKTFEKLRFNCEFRAQFDDDDLQELLDNCTDYMAELKYYKEKPKWASCKALIKQIAFTLESFEADNKKSLKISKCLLENITNHDLLYRKNTKFLATSSLALGAVKFLYQFSKLPANDELFIEEDLIETIYSVTLSIISEDSYTKMSLPYDFLLYLLGSIKNLTTNPSISSTSTKFLSLLTSLLPSPSLEEQPHSNSKHEELLVQVSGILKNLTSSNLLESIMELEIIERLMVLIKISRDHEILLNCLKALTKVSLEGVINATLRRYIWVLFDVLARDNDPMVVSRACYVLANVLNEYNSEKDLDHAPDLENLLAVMAGCIGSTEPIIVDMLVKIARLIANILIPTHIIKYFEGSEALLKHIIDILQFYKEDLYEELILNSVSCLSNLLYYDTPSTPIISDHNRLISLSKLASLLVSNFQEELTTQVLRCLSNLTQHDSICKELPNLHLIEIFFLLLNHSNWNIVFYALGCFVNISNSTKELIYSEKSFDTLINFFDEVQVSESEFARMICMIFCNLCSLSKGLVPWESVAGEENVERLAGLAKKVAECGEGEERGIADGLIEMMPKPFVPCLAKGCGRKFQNKEMLQEHWKRRHMTDDE